MAGVLYPRPVSPVKKLWFQLHWFIGTTAGTILMVIGLSGAALAFREEILDWLNPGVRSVAAQDAPMLAPQQIAQAVTAALPAARIAGITVVDTPGASARVSLSPAPGEKRGVTVYINSYTGALMPPMRHEDFFETAESLHRFLLLPREAGRPVAGALALCLMFLSLSGLYLRWPRRAFDWRAWLTLDLRMKGRAFLSGLHAVAGTWVLLVFLSFTSSGVYWAFDPVRDLVDGWLGTLRPPRAAAAKPPPAKGSMSKPETPDLTLSWAAFQQAAPDWRMAVLRLPERAGQPLQIQWVAKDAPHVRARSRMLIDPQTGKLLKNEPYAAQPLGARFQSTFYPLHLGLYFGVTGQIIVLLAALALPGFAITGWMLYLKRRKLQRSGRGEPGPLAVQPGGTPDDTVLMAYASQTGQAERLALQSAAALQSAGVAVHVQSLEKLTPPQLGKYRRALFVASSFGDGGPPDNAVRFSRLLHAAGEELMHLQYAVLALGDRNYVQFCGFGHALHQRLSVLGAQPLHPIIEVDQGDAGALARWGQALRGLMGGGAGVEVALSAAASDSDYANWRLARRELLNPGSVGDPLYEITLTGDVGAGWRPGALVDIWPGHYGKDAAARRYSLASLPQDGSMQLLVRQVRHAQGLGLASGWLTAHAAIGDAVRVRLIANPAFDAHDDAAPAICIGNGSGMAGLRSHLRHRVRMGARRNWLIYGERQRAHDAICAAEIGQWQANGFLPELDLVYSRDAGGGGYVQDRLRARAGTLRDWISAGAAVYVCGSLSGMAEGVEAALADILGHEQLRALTDTGRYRRDVY